MKEAGRLRRILWTFCLAEFLVMQIWYNFSAVLAPLKEAWMLSNFQAGMIVSMFQLGYVIAVFFFSFLSDNHNPQKLFIAGSLLTGLASILFALWAEGFYSALFFRIVAGIGMGGVYVPGMKLLAEIFPLEQRGKAIGIYVSSLVVGTGTSLLLSGMLAKVLSWDLLIILTSLGALLGAFLVYRLGAIPVRTVKNKLTWELVRKVTRPPSMAVNASYLGHMWELHAMWPWIGPFMVAMVGLQGFPAKDAQMYGNIIGGFSIIIGSIATWVGGALSDRHGRINIILIFLLGSIFCSFTIGWVGPWSLWAAGLWAVLYGFLVIGDSPVYSTAITELVDEDLTGLALGIQSVMGFAVTIISPLVFGLLLDTTHSWGLAFVALGCGALIGPLALLKLKGLPESFQMAGGKQ
ncbi:MFS transporter [Desulforamulus ruminis]|uniref:MFS transporter n=1 Tax=Desulforamulus ruminis TaxID=1564 RepID=UPI002FDA36D8